MEAETKDVYPTEMGNGKWSSLQLISVPGIAGQVCSLIRAELYKEQTQHVTMHNTTIKSGRSVVPPVFHPDKSASICKYAG